MYRWTYPKFSRRVLNAGLYTGVICVAVGHSISPLAAKTWHVTPGGVTTIQAAIDSATNGDSVLVDAGTYFEHLDFGIKNIVLRGMNGPDSVIVDGSKKGTVLRLRQGVVEQLTIRNGFTPNEGAGVFIVNPLDSTILRHNVIEDNNAGTEQKTGQGAGIAIENDLLRRVVVEDNIVRNNAAGASGGGISSAGGIIRRNRIYRNYARNSGGGVHMGGTILESNIIYQNATEFGGAGVGLKLGGTGEILNNTVVGNRTLSSGFDHGCGIDALPGWPQIRNNLVVDNHSDFGHGGAGIRCGSMYPPECNNSWGNDTDSIIGPHCEGSTATNFSVDPLFCDPGNANYTLRGNSPCTAAAQPGCGLIGALSIGCQSPVRPTTIGQLKERYR